MALPRELEILLRCTGTRPSEEAEARLAALLEDPVDWERVLELAELNRVVPMLHWNLSRPRRAGVPEAVGRSLTESFDGNLAWNRVRAAKLEEVAQDFERRGIPYLSFKGPILAERYYGDLGLRMFWDLDLLVPPGDLTRAFDALRGLGFEPEPDRSPRERAFYQRYHFAYYFFSDCEHDDRKCRVEIDLHFSFLPRTWSIPIDYEGLWSRSEAVRLGRGMVKTPGAEDLLFCIAVHGTKESWARLRMVADLAAVLVARPELDLERLLAHAGRQGGRRMLLLGSYLASEWLDAPVPGAVLAEARADRAVAAIERERREILVQGKLIRHDLSSVTRYRCRVLDRPVDRARYVWRTLLTPRTLHLHLVRLPRFLSFLYVPLKVVHDYLFQPAWSLIKRGRDLIRRSGRGRS